VATKLQELDARNEEGNTHGPEEIKWPAEGNWIGQQMDS
jgi:hypothetical protein